MMFLFSTALNRIQNHREGGIASVYDRHGYAAEAQARDHAPSSPCGKPVPELRWTGITNMFAPHVQHFAWSLAREQDCLERSPFHTLASERTPEYW